MRTKGIGPKGLGGGKLTPNVGSAEYKRLYENGSIMSTNEYGELTDQLPEVVIKAYNRNNLSKDEKKVYDKFYSRSKPVFEKNSNYNSSKPTSGTNRKTIPTGERERTNFKNTKHIRAGGEAYVLDAYGAVKMFRDSGASFSEEPSTYVKNRTSLGSNKYRYNPDKPDLFRGHANSATSTIHVGKRDGLKTVVAELAHVFPGMAPKPTIKGTYERVKRFFKEKKMPDKSNYKSEHDLEYKTHTGPNSVENKLMKMYGTKYDNKIQ